VFEKVIVAVGVGQCYKMQPRAYYPFHYIPDLLCERDEEEESLKGPLSQQL